MRDDYFSNIYLSLIGASLLLGLLHLDGYFARHVGPRLYTSYKNVIIILPSNELNMCISNFKC